MVLITLPLTAIVIAFVGSVVLSLGMKYFVTENTTWRGLVQLTWSTVVGFSMTSSLTAALIVATSPIWGIVVLFATMMVLLVIIGLFIVQPLTKRGYFGKKQKWFFELSNDQEFLSAVNELDAKRVNDIAKMSADKDHFKQQVVDAADATE